MDENRSRFDGERAGAASFPTKATAVFLALLLLIPMLVFTAIPNMFFGYGGSGTDEITRITQQAMALGSTYMTLENFENNLIESIINKIIEELRAHGIFIGSVEIEKIFGKDDLEWFIAIASVSCRQDLDALGIQDVLDLCAYRLIHEYTLLGTLTNILKVTVKHRGPDILMNHLGFDEEERTWAEAIYEVLTESEAIEEYASYF